MICKHYLDPKCVDFYDASVEDKILVIHMDAIEFFPMKFYTNSADFILKIL